MKTSAKSAYLSVLIASFLLLTGCESKWEKMPNEELASKSSKCLSIRDPGAAMIQVCKNVKRECLRRRELGIYIC